MGTGSSIQNCSSKQIFERLVSELGALPHESLNSAFVQECVALYREKKNRIAVDFWQAQLTVEL